MPGLERNGREIDGVETVVATAGSGKLPDPPAVAFVSAREREAASLPRIDPGGSYDPKLPRWPHRVRVPALLVRGAKGRGLPVEQARRGPASSRGRG